MSAETDEVNLYVAKNSIALKLSQLSDLVREYMREALSDEDAYRNMNTLMEKRIRLNFKGDIPFYFAGGYELLLWAAPHTPIHDSNTYSCLHLLAVKGRSVCVCEFQAHRLLSCC